LQAVVPGQVIVSHVRRDGEGGLSALIYRHCDGAGRMAGIFLDELIGETEAADRLSKRGAPVISADAADPNARMAELVSVEGEVARGAAKLPAARQQVPEHFAESDDLHAFRLHPPTPFRVALVHFPTP